MGGEGRGGEGRRQELRLSVISTDVFTRRSTAAGVQVQLQVRAGGRQRYFRECGGFSSLGTDSRAGRTYSWRAAGRLSVLVCGRVLNHWGDLIYLLLYVPGVSVRILLCSKIYRAGFIIFPHTFNWFHPAMHDHNRCFLCIKTHKPRQYTCTHLPSVRVRAWLSGGRPLLSRQVLLCHCLD